MLIAASNVFGIYIYIDSYFRMYFIIILSIVGFKKIVVDAREKIVNFHQIEMVGFTGTINTISDYACVVRNKIKIFIVPSYL